MSSATSIDTAKGRSRTEAPPPAADTPPASGLTAGQFFLLVGLGCATAATVMARGQGVTSIILLTMLIGSTALVGVAALRTLNPLVTTEDDRTAVIGSRTRAALEREKTLVLRAIKELEFDRAMGKVSETDFHEMSSRMRARASRLIRQLDAGSGYREQIERDLARRLGGDEGPAGRLRQSGDGPSQRSADAAPAPRAASSATASAAGAEAFGERACVCGTLNDDDAKFCKACGRQL